MKKGMIKFFNEEKNYGFIISEDGVDYFFHNSENKSMVVPQKGMQVTFIAKENDKGPYAADIRIDRESIQIAKNTQKFISFGNDTLKVSNIKSYGISKTEANFEKNRSDDGLPKVLEYTLDILLLSTTYEETRVVDYLYVTTYQNDNYQYIQGKCGFDVHRKKEELDVLFGNT